ncbi:MAG: N-acetylmuramic acid 6-phosphate etherase [Cellulosilyticaceae bacterium]
MHINLNELMTEQRNKKSMAIDQMTTFEMLKVINDEDKTVPYAIERELPQIAKAIDAIYEHMKNGGRLIYCGAGTSGRLGVLDAVECGPTYGVSDEVVQGLLAGGMGAMFKSREGAEDNPNLCEEALNKLNFNQDDILVGLAASGRTPYVIGGLTYAKKIGALTVAIVCNKGSQMGAIVDFPIEIVVGPEVVTGSTRMKAGTTQKLVLNMLSTCVMIKTGKVYSNLMVDVRASNEKLVERAKRIVIESTGCEMQLAESFLELTEYDVKLAILMIKAGIDKETAAKLLEECEGHISVAIAKGAV